MIENCYVCRNIDVCKRYLTDERLDKSKHCCFCYPTEEAKMRETEAYKLGRADTIDELFEKAFDVDMDSNLIYIRFDKDDFDVPFMTKKEQLKEWLQEQLKEQK